jgi:hypothetical protein
MLGADHNDTPALTAVHAITLLATELDLSEWLSLACRERPLKPLLPRGAFELHVLALKYRCSASCQYIWVSGFAHEFVLQWYLLLLLLHALPGCQPRPFARWGLLLQMGNTALHYAAKSGHLEVVEQLLGAGAVANHVNQVRSPPCLAEGYWR